MWRVAMADLMPADSVPAEQTESSERQPALRISHAFKRFGGLIAVNDVSIEVYPGEVVALLGDNGAGKSTLVKMISGVYSMDAGDMYFNGERVTLHTPASARKL